MDQQRHVEHPAVEAGFHQGGADGQLLAQLAALDPAQGRDRPDGVLVHRVVVVHVELHHGDDPAEGGDEGAERPHLVHQPQRPLGVVVAGEQREEDAVGPGVGADPVVDQVQVGRRHAQGVGVDLRLAGQAALEEAQDVDWIGEEGLAVLHVEAAGAQHVALAGGGLAAAAEGVAQAAAERGAGADVAGLERGEEDAGEVADVLGVGEIFLHEPLDRALAAGGLVAEDLGDLDLGVEGELFRGAAGQQVQVDPAHPEEGLGLGEDRVFLGGEHRLGDQVGGGIGAVEVLGDPEQGLEVAQAALALLDVGLQHVAGVALAGVALGPLGELELEELRAGGGEELAPKPVVEGPREGGVAPEPAVLQQAGADGHVGLGLADALVRRAGGMADLQPQVPEAVEDALDQALAPGGLLVGGEEEQVDVGEGRHLGPAVAADGDDRDPLGRGRVRQRVQPLRGEVEGEGDDPVGQPGVVVDRPVGLARAFGHQGGDAGAALGVMGAQHADRGGAAGGALSRAADRRIHLGRRGGRVEDRPGRGGEAGPGRAGRGVARLGQVSCQAAQSRAAPGR